MVKIFSAVGGLLIGALFVALQIRYYVALLHRFIYLIVGTPKPERPSNNDLPELTAIRYGPSDDDWELFVD